MRTPSLALLVFALGCSSSTTSTPSAASDETGVATETGASDETGAAEAGDETAAAEAGAMLLAPTVTMVMKMDGALHVMWTNRQKDCDSVEVERKTDTDPYKVVYTVPGTVNNKMDAAATADMTYTYRTRCKLGADYSPYSNEKSQNPVR